MEKSRAALHNLGCKVNAYELEAMAQQLEKAGYEIVPFAPGADIYVINTCTVTSIADRKSRQLLHRAKKMNPEALVVAVGCYVQTDGEALEKDPAIDLLIGSSGKRELVRRIEEALAARAETPEKPAKETAAGPALHREDLSGSSSYGQLHIDRVDMHTRAFLKVQDGCNNFCSYCIIPYARGRVRSRSVEDAVAEAERLAASGCREVVLTGIHLCSYGAEEYSEGRRQLAFLQLIRAVAAVPGIARVRLGSLEPSFLTADFVRDLSEIGELCPHFHLSLQSGCDATLARMNRRYTTDGYRRSAALLREHFDRPSLATDIIAGFPGETAEEFDQTLRFTEEMDFFETHIFPYSRRAGTRAAAFPDQVPETEKRRRAEILLALNGRTHAAHLERAAGGQAEVLFEERTGLAGTEVWIGHTPRYERVALASEEDLRGRLETVTLQRPLAEGVLSCQRKGEGGVPADG